MTSNLGNNLVTIKIIHVGTYAVQWIITKCEKQMNFCVQNILTFKNWTTTFTIIAI